jgi:arylformamidase
MELSCIIDGTRYRLDTLRRYSLTRPVHFVGGITIFGAPLATKEPFATEGFTGDVSAGGSCNCDMLHFSPHLHGTHTESVGHIVRESVPVHTILPDHLLKARVVRVTPVLAQDTDDSYVPEPRPDDKMITRQMLENALETCPPAFREAVIVDTGWTPDKPNAPFFSTEAMAYLHDAGVQHILVDTPSVDKLDDGGHLSNHHLFFDIKQGSRTLDGATPTMRTISEWLAIPKQLPAGCYVLNLQVAAIDSDATPSNPLLYELIPT